MQTVSENNYFLRTGHHGIDACTFYINKMLNNISGKSTSHQTKANNSTTRLDVYHNFLLNSVSLCYGMKLEKKNRKVTLILYCDDRENS